MKNKGFPIKNLLTFLTIMIFFTACATKQPVLTSSATILFKTPKMKFYDKGFINKFSDFTQVQIFTAGQVVLDMKIFDDRVCTSTFKCKDVKTFNKEYLSSSYEDDFLKKLFEKPQKNIIHRDKKNKIFIKILKD